MILLQLSVSVSSILLSGHNKVLVVQEHVHYFPTVYETGMGFWNICRRDAQKGFPDTLHKPLKQLTPPQNLLVIQTRTSLTTRERSNSQRAEARTTGHKPTPFTPHTSSSSFLPQLSTCPLTLPKTPPLPSPIQQSKSPLPNQTALS